MEPPRETVGAENLLCGVAHGLRVVTSRSVLPEVDHAPVRLEKVQEPLVLVLADAQELQRSPVVAAGNSQSPMHQLSQVVAGEIAVEKRLIDIAPEALVTRDERVEQVVDHLIAVGTVRVARRRREK